MYVTNCTNRREEFNTPSSTLYDMLETTEILLDWLGILQTYVKDEDLL
jgi:hypothetical protein